jgi:hypothetical protein
VPLLSKRCAQCGERDLIRFGKGVTEVLMYTALTLATVGVACWLVAGITL